MGCSHIRQRHTADGWKCRACNEIVPYEKPDDIAAAIRSVQTTVEQDLDLSGHLYNFRKGMKGREVERRHGRACAAMRQAERDGDKLREVDGIRHTMRIPSEAYFAARKKYGSNFLEDKKVARKMRKEFSVTADNE